MNNPMYTKKISEDDKFATVAQAMDYFKISRNSLLKIAEENHCVIRIGRCVRINISKLTDTVEKLC
ncbi:MAG: hypothetical protein E7271_10745 [Lachnospiraceae bacterium]|nr:hypothetical protein [Lachnospiraceae bacterium]